MVLTNLKIVKVLVYIRSVEKQTCVLSAATKEVFFVQFDTEVGKQIGYVGNALVACRVLYLCSWDCFSDVAKVLVGSVCVEIE